MFDAAWRFSDLRDCGDLQNSLWKRLDPSSLESSQPQNHSFLRWAGLLLVRCLVNGNWKWISQSTDKVTRKKSPLTTFSFPLLLLSCPKISFLLFSRSTYSRRKIRKLLAALFSRNFLPFSPPPSCYVGALAFLLTYEIVVLVATEWKKWTVRQGYTTSFMSHGHLPSPSAHF